MAKSDKTKHNICIASIKRSTIKPYEFKWTKFYEENLDFLNTCSEIPLELADDELMICSTIIDLSNFSILYKTKALPSKAGLVDSNITLPLP